MSESNGLGDSVAKLTSFFGIDKVADAVAKLVGAPGCGCKERQEYLNQLFPYEGYKRSFTVAKPIMFHDMVFEPGTQVDVTVTHRLFPNVINFVKDGYLIEI